MKFSKALAVLAASAVMTGFLAAAATRIIPERIVPVSAEDYAEGRTDDLSYRLNEKEGYAIITKCIGTITGEYSIPSEIQGFPVTAIAYDAFKGQTGITALTIPDTVTEVTEYPYIINGHHGAFQNCTGLRSVVIGRGLKRIANEMFRGCSHLESVTFGDSVTEIGDSAFLGCTALRDITLPAGLTSIGANAFSGCKNAAAITLPVGLLSIGKAAFYACDSITGLAIPDTVTTISESAFEKCAGIKTASIGKSAEIGVAAFRGCTGMTELTLSEGITAISYEAFKDCTSLKSVIIPDTVSRISGYSYSSTVNHGAFQNCTSLSSVRLGSNLNTIGGETFKGCSMLTVIDIPESVSVIQRDAFRDTSLTKVTIRNDDCTIDESVTTIPVAEDGVMYGAADSKAAAYAEKNGIAFVVLGETAPAATTALTAATAPAETTTSPAKPTRTVNPDINGDGVINAKDANEILVYAAKLGTGSVKDFDEYMEKYHPQV